MFNIKHEDTRIVANDVALLSLRLTSNTYYTFFSISMIDFEQVNVCWVPTQTLQIRIFTKFTLAIKLK